MTATDKELFDRLVADGISNIDAVRAMAHGTLPAAAPPEPADHTNVISFARARAERRLHCKF
jgi:hypothetical protein